MANGWILLGNYGGHPLKKRSFILGFFQKVGRSEAILNSGGNICASKSSEFLVEQFGEINGTTQLDNIILVVKKFLKIKNVMLCKNILLPKHLEAPNIRECS